MEIWTKNHSTFDDLTNVLRKCFKISSAFINFGANGLSQKKIIYSPVQPHEGISRSAAELISLIFAASKQTIANSWRFPVINVSEVQTQMNRTIFNEILTAISLDNYEKTWTPWILHTQPNPATLNSFVIPQRPIGEGIPFSRSPLPHPPSFHPPSCPPYLSFFFWALFLSFLIFNLIAS